MQEKETRIKHDKSRWATQKENSHKKGNIHETDQNNSLKRQLSIGKWVIGPSQCPWLFIKGSLKMRHSKSNIRVLNSYVACQLSARGRRDALNV